MLRRFWLRVARVGSKIKLHGKRIDGIMDFCLVVDDRRSKAEGSLGKHFSPRRSSLLCQQSLI